MRKIQSKYIKIAIIVVIAGSALYAVMSIIDNIGLVWNSIGIAVRFVLGILSPVIIGFILAFLLARPSTFFGRLICLIPFFSKRKKAAQSLGVLIALLVLISLIVLFFYLMIPGIVDSVGGISREMPKYAQSVDRVLNDLSKDPTVVQVSNFIGFDVTKVSSTNALLTEYWSYIAGFLKELAGSAFGFIVNTGLFLYNFVLGLFFSIYMLLFRDQLKGQIRALSQNFFRKSHYRIVFAVDITDDMFYRFLVGKGICSLAVGIIAFAVCSLLGFKYAPLISLIIAVTNMIPTFGPFIGAVPALLLSMMTAPVYALYMIIIIVGLTFIDGNIIGPRVLGDSMGINAFWIMFSIIVMGALFGVIGMLIAAPLFAVLRILLKNWIYHKNHGTLEGEAEYIAGKERFRQWTTRKKKEPVKKTAKAPESKDGAEK
jgi:predicted PurR-regulated permease PerM